MTLKRGHPVGTWERIYRAFILGFQNKYGAYSEFDVNVIHLANSIPQFVGPYVHNLDLKVLREQQNEFILFQFKDLRTISEPYNWIIDLSSSF